MFLICMMAILGLTQSFDMRAAAAADSPQPSEELLKWAADRGYPCRVSALFLIPTTRRDYRNDNSPLYGAAEEGNLKIVKELLAVGADCNARLFNTNHQDQPLHTAAERGHVEVVQALLTAGADLNSPNRWSNTPMHYAAEKGHEQVVRLLLEKGASVDKRNLWGQTPLDRVTVQARYNRSDSNYASYASIVELLTAAEQTQQQQPANDE